MRLQGQLLRWFQGAGEVPWGSAPGDYDPAAVSETLGRVGRLFGPRRYFGLEARGLEAMPAPPVLLVSNHSGGTSIPDVWGLLAAWYRHFGVERPLHVLAHEIILGTSATARYFGRRGVLAAEPGIARAVLTEHRRDLLLMPGGDLDTWRPHRDRYRVCFGGRLGYARLALETGVPIVPVASAGAHDTLYILSRGDRLAKALGLHRVARAQVWPVHLSLPWGLAVGPWPHLPVPVKLRYRFGSALTPGPDERAEALDERVRSAVQGLLDGLEAETRGRRD